MSVVASLYGVPFVEHYFNIKFSLAAVIVTFMWIGIAIGAPVIGFMTDKADKIKLSLSLCALLALLVFISILFLNIQSVIVLIVLFFMLGMACAGQALSFSLVSRNNEAFNRATAIGFNNIAVVISGFVFQPCGRRQSTTGLPVGE